MTPPLHPSLHRVATCLAAAAVLLLSACSTTAPPAAEHTAASATIRNSWSGRLGLQVHDPMTQEQSLSASFALQGNPAQGQLDVFNPFGSQIAQLQWRPGHAVLRQGDHTHHSDSLQELLQRSLGTSLPIHALFSWLHGQPEAAEGWQVDLRRHAQGRITAQRSYPLPRTTLRLVLQP